MAKKIEIVILVFSESDIETIASVLEGIELNERCYYLVFFNFRGSHEAVDELGSKECGQKCEYVIRSPKRGKFQILTHNDLLMLHGDELVVEHRFVECFLGFLYEIEEKAALFFIGEPEERSLYNFKKLKSFGHDLFLPKEVHDAMDSDDEFGLFSYIDGWFEKKSVNAKIESLLRDTGIEAGDVLTEEFVGAVDELFFVDIGYYKREKIADAVASRMQTTGVQTPQEYLELLKANEKEGRLFLSVVFDIGCTFFHDHEQQKSLEELLRVIFGRKYDEPVRIWIPACGTGEEAVYCALFLNELVQKSGLMLKTQIYATDICESAVSFGLMPHFSQLDIRELDSDLVKNGFIQNGDDYTLKPHIKESIIVAEHNLLEDTLFTNIDLILCRNFIEDIDDESFEKAKRIFNKALVIDGFLMLDCKERECCNNRFQPFESSKDVYVNKLDTSESDETDSDDVKEQMINTLIAQTIKSAGLNYIVIDKEKKVVIKNGDLSFFFENYDELVGTDIISSAKEIIRYEMQSVLEKTFAMGSPSFERVPYIKSENRPSILNLNVIPLPNNNIVQDMILIVFSHPSQTQSAGHQIVRPGVKFR